MLTTAFVFSQMERFQKRRKLNSPPAAARRPAAAGVSSTPDTGLQKGESSLLSLPDSMLQFWLGYLDVSFLLQQVVLVSKHLREQVFKAEVTVLSFPRGMLSHIPNGNLVIRHFRPGVFPLYMPRLSRERRRCCSHCEQLQGSV